MKEKEVILVGSGGHALSLAEFSDKYILGYISLAANTEMPGEWLGDDSRASDYVSQGKRFHISYVYSGLPVMLKRKKLIKAYENWGAEFSTLKAPSAIITPNSRIGDGCAIMTGAIINRSKLGKHVIVNSGAIVEHDCVVGSNTFIGPGAIIGGFTEIGENCFIGLGARIGNNIKIADNVSVAMGAVVSRDLTEPGIYHGIPLRCFKIDKIKF